MATYAATFQDWSNAIAKQVFGVGAPVCDVQAAGRQNDDKNNSLYHKLSRVERPFQAVGTIHDGLERPSYRVVSRRKAIWYRGTSFSFL